MEVTLASEYRWNVFVSPTILQGDNRTKDCCNLNARTLIFSPIHLNRKKILCIGLWSSLLQVKALWVPTATNGSLPAIFQLHLILQICHCVVMKSILPTWRSFQRSLAIRRCKPNTCGNPPACLLDFMLHHRSIIRQWRPLSSVYKMWLSDKKNCQAVAVSEL